MCVSVCVAVLARKIFSNFNYANELNLNYDGRKEKARAAHTTQLYCTATASRKRKNETVGTHG